MAESPAKTSSANLSDLVKEMVKEMDANDFYSRGDMYDESAEVSWWLERDIGAKLRIALLVCWPFWKSKPNSWMLWWAMTLYCYYIAPGIAFCIQKRRVTLEDSTSLQQS